jgi:hypothetical protein
MRIVRIGMTAAISLLFGLLLAGCSGGGGSSSTPLTNNVGTLTEPSTKLFAFTPSGSASIEVILADFISTDPTVAGDLRNVLFTQPAAGSTAWTLDANNSSSFSTAITTGTNFIGSYQVEVFVFHTNPTTGVVEQTKFTVPNLVNLNISLNNGGGGPPPPPFE